MIGRKTFSAALLVCVLAFSLWLRWPMVPQGNPFFYQEDEAHHFNRIVEMVKEGTLNPRYFHKPSLHFYLRMPAVLLGLLVEKPERGKTVRQIRTRDHFGLAKYSFSWSHPRVVMAVRGVTLLLVMLSCLLVYILARQLLLPVSGAIAATIFFAVSPELLNYSGFIGVDVPLMFFAALTTVIALFVQPRLTTRNLICLGVISGLAVSCKYNGLPIALLPVIAVLSSPTLRKSALHIMLALVTPAAGFFLGSPYILLSFPLFYQQLSYEIWHYGVAGHVGHSAEPGIPQLIHYFRWLMQDGIGPQITILAVAGIVAIVVRRPINRRYWQAAIFIGFPLLFLALMCAQRANFVRNMLPILPYLAVLAAVSTVSLANACSTSRMLRSLIVLTVTGLVAFTPLRRSLEIRAAAAGAPESRVQLEQFLSANLRSADVAVTGDLQPHPSLRRMKNVSIVGTSPAVDTLFQKGFSLLATQGAPRSESELVGISQDHLFAGDESEMRVLKNPAVALYRLEAPAMILRFAEQLEPIDIALNRPLGDPSEGHLWINHRINRVRFPGLAQNHSPVRLRLTVMTPWKDQRIELIGNDWNHQVLLNAENPGEWKSVDIELPASALLNGDQLVMSIDRVTSPLSQGINADPRRLGIALREAAVP